MEQPRFDIYFFESPEQEPARTPSDRSHRVEITDRQLMRLEIVPKIESAQQVAKQFVAAERAPSERTIMHSRIQNRLIRSRLNGVTSVSAREIIREAAVLLPGKNVSQDVGLMFIGVDSAIRSIQKDQKLFQEQHRPHEVQQICFDERLDAHFAIDYIEFRLNVSEQNTVDAVNEIRLVQVKTRAVFEEERAMILRNHRAYVETLFSRKAVLQQKHKRAVEHIRSGRFFETEIREKNTNNIDLAERFFEDYFDVIDELIQTINEPISEQRVQSWLEKYGYSQTDFFFFACLLSGTREKNDVTKRLFALLDLDAKIEDQFRLNLANWVEQVESSSIDYSILSHESEPSGTFFSGASIMSVIHHGGIREEISLFPISDKAVRLTPRTSS